MYGQPQTGQKIAKFNRLTIRNGGHSDQCTTLDVKKMVAIKRPINYINCKYGQLGMFATKRQ